MLELSGKGSLADRFDKQVKTIALEIYRKVSEEGFGVVEGGLSENERKDQDKKKVEKGLGSGKRNAVRSAIRP